MALNVYNENNDFDLLFNFFEDIFGRCQNMKFIFTGKILSRSDWSDWLSGSKSVQLIYSEI